MGALDSVDPARLSFPPPAHRQIGLEKIVFVAVKRKLQAEWTMLVQKAVCSGGSVFCRHCNVDPLVALDLSEPPDGAYRALEVQLKDARMPQRVLDRGSRNPRIPRNELDVPLGCLASCYHWHWLASIKIVLPMCKVQHQAQIVPCQNASQTCAQLLRVWRLYVLVRPLVYAELLLPDRIREQRTEGGLDLREQHRRRQALHENSIAIAYYGVADNLSIGVDEAVQAAVDEAGSKDVAGLKVLETFEEELGGKLDKVDDRSALPVPCQFFAFFAFCALVV